VAVVGVMEGGCAGRTQKGISFPPAESLTARWQSFPEKPRRRGVDRPGDVCGPEPQISWTCIGAWRIPFMKEAHLARTTGSEAEHPDPAIEVAGVVLSLWR